MFYLDQYIYVIRTYHIFKAARYELPGFPCASSPRLLPASLAAWRVFFMELPPRGVFSL